jgi:hypothetical protein
MNSNPTPEPLFSVPLPQPWLLDCDHPGYAGRFGQDQTSQPGAGGAPLLKPMTIEEKIRQIMISEELPDSEKLDRLHALIPPDACKIDKLNKATPVQLRQLKDGLAVTGAMQRLRRTGLRADDI